MNRPKTNLNWLWWGLGAFIVSIIIFRLGALSANSSIEGTGKKVGIIKINGPIISSESTVSQLEKFKNRKDISAIVLRIDSPGGLVAPTQEIYEKVKSLRGIKPVVTSMGSVAASGGYYIALGSDTLIANPGTIVGSIGVIMNYPIATELLGKVGIKFETVKSGNLKDVGSYSREVTDADRKHLNDMVTNIHSQFVSAVGENRSIKRSELIKLADGRVFTGLQSKELGLIDLLGTYEDAIALAGSMSQIKGKPKTVQINKKNNSFLDLFTSNLEQATSSWFDELPAYRWRME
ncbi:MAG: signal peptide peptidase SppA [Candidatus Neomarinimicrobiota bacterium]|nr:signal peptide peptidase SppA [Candidatus Neomarinimicrobiota bacterium]